MDLLSTLFRNKPNSLEIIRQYLAESGASSEILDYINDAVATWQKYVVTEDGSMNISDYGFDDEPDVSITEISKKVTDHLKFLKAEYESSGRESLQKTIGYWENYDPAYDIQPGKELFKDYGEISYEKFSLMVDFAGQIWMQLYKIDSLLRYSYWSVENVKHEIDQLIAFKEYVYSLPEEFLYSDEPERDERRNEAREYFRITEGFYGLNPLQSISINNTTSYVYGKFIGYYFFLYDKLQELNNKIPIRQHALICHYKQEAGMMLPFGYEQGSVNKLLIPKDCDRYANENDLDNKAFQRLFTQISVEKYSAENRTKKDTGNIKDLKAVINLFETAPDSFGLTYAIHLAKNDLLEAQGGITVEQIAYTVYYKIARNYMQPFKRDKTKRLKEISKTYGKNGFKSLEAALRSVHSVKYRQSGSEKNIDTLRWVALLLNGFPEAQIMAQNDLRKAEQNKSETEGSKRKV